MLDQETKRRIDTARDILVGKLPNPQAQVEQITIAMIYKFMDDMDKEAMEFGGEATFFTGEFEKYSWTKIFDPKLGGFEMLALYGEAIVKLNQNPNIPQLFRDIFKNAFLPYRDPETLKLFLKIINEFTYDHSEKLGDAFEYLLSVLGSQGDAGQFRTPRHIIDFIVSIVQPKKEETICDPACGTAGFLISAYKHILNENTKKTKGDLLTPDDRKKLINNFIGYDISAEMVRLSLVNMYLHGFPTPHIYEYDTLTSEERWGDYFDIILANPPFMTPKGGIRPHKKFAMQANRSEVLFVDYIMEHINPTTGRAAVIVPEGIIFQSAGAYKELRKLLVEKNFLYGVVSLPAGIFQPYSGVKTSILLLDKTLAKKTDKILFVKIENDGFSLGAQRKEISQNDLPDASTLIKNYTASVRNDDFSQIDFDNLPLNAIVTEKVQIKENGEYNLSGERYRVQAKRHTKFDIVTLGDVADVTSGQSPESDNYNEDGIGTPFYQGRTEFGDIYVKPPKVWTTKITKTAQKDDILMSVRAPVGPVNICTQEICIGRGLAAIKPNEKILPKYLFTFLLHNQVEIKGDGGAVFDSINRTQLLNLKIPLPPLSVQQEIVTKIEQFEKIIAGAKQVIENYKPQIDINPDWEMVELGSVCEILGGYAFKSEDYVSEGVQLIRMGNVKQMFFDVKNSPSFLPIGFIDEYSNYVLNKGDILISMTGTVGKEDYGNVCRINIDDKFLLNQRVGKFQITSESLNRDYLYYLANSSDFRKQIFSNSAGGVRQSNISNKGIERIVIPLPSIQEQEAVVEQIEKEQRLVDGNKEIIQIFEQKIAAEINKLWEE